MTSKDLYESIAEIFPSISRAFVAQRIQNLMKTETSTKRIREILVNQIVRMSDYPKDSNSDQTPAILPSNNATTAATPSDSRDVQPALFKIIFVAITVM
jgi:hypothetical protein